MGACVCVYVCVQKTTCSRASLLLLCPGAALMEPGRLFAWGLGSGLGYLAVPSFDLDSGAKPVRKHIVFHVFHGLKDLPHCFLSLRGLS